MFRFRSSLLKDVPYSRLVDTCNVILPVKLDSDSKLHTDKPKIAVVVPENELIPKSSASDSKLAVDYFNSSSSYDQHLRMVIKQMDSFIFSIFVFIKKIL